jgi:Ca2+-binding EF-hand superfamily protein
LNVLVLEKVRTDLAKRGTKTIRSIGASFKILDDNRDRKIDKQELYWGLKDLGCNISKREAGILLEILDTNQDGFVNYDEFLIGIRGRPNATRQEVIDRAFAKFDKDGSGVIDSADLSVVYDCTKHPKVVSGEMTSDDVFIEFLASFGDKNGDGKLTHAEWNDYYAGVSSSIDNDAHFCQLMVTAWKL